MIHLSLEALAQYAAQNGLTIESLLKRAKINEQVRKQIQDDVDLKLKSTLIGVQTLERLASTANCKPADLEQKPYALKQASGFLEPDAVMGFLGLLTGAIGLSTANKPLILLPTVIAVVIIVRAFYARLNRQRKVRLLIAAFLSLVVASSYAWQVWHRGKGIPTSPLVILAEPSFASELEENGVRDELVANTWPGLKVAPQVELTTARQVGPASKGAHPPSLVTIAALGNSIRIHVDINPEVFLKDYSPSRELGVGLSSEWTSASFTLHTTRFVDALRCVKQYWHASLRALSGDFARAEVDFQELSGSLRSLDSSSMNPDVHLLSAAAALMQNRNEAAVEYGRDWLESLAPKPIEWLKTTNRVMEWTVAALLLWCDHRTAEAYEISGEARVRFPDRYCYFSALEARLRVQQGGTENTAQVRAIARDARSRQCAERSLLDYYEADLAIRVTKDPAELDKLAENLRSLDFGLLKGLAEKEKAMQLCWDLGVQREDTLLLQKAWQENDILLNEYPQAISLVNGSAYMAYDVGDLEYCVAMTRRATKLAGGHQPGTFANLYKSAEAYYMLGAWGEAAESRKAAYSLLKQNDVVTSGDERERKLWLWCRKATIACLLAGKRQEALSLLAEGRSSYPTAWSELGNIEREVLGKIQDSGFGAPAKNTENESTADRIYCILSAASSWSSSELVRCVPDPYVTIQRLEASLGNLEIFEYDLSSIALCAYAERTKVDPSAQRGLNQLVEGLGGGLLENVSKIKRPNFTQRVVIRRTLQSYRCQVCRTVSRYDDLPLTDESRRITSALRSLEDGLMRSEEISRSRVP